MARRASRGISSRGETLRATFPLEVSQQALAALRAYHQLLETMHAGHLLHDVIQQVFFAGMQFADGIGAVVSPLRAKLQVVRDPPLDDGRKGSRLEMLCDPPFDVDDTD